MSSRSIGAGKFGFLLKGASSFSRDLDRELLGIMTLRLRAGE